MSVRQCHRILADDDPNVSEKLISTDQTSTEIDENSKIFDWTERKAKKTPPKKARLPMVPSNVGKLF